MNNSLLATEGVVTYVEIVGKSGLDAKYQRIIFR